MVCTDNKQRIVKPRHLGCRSKKFAQGIVCISDRFLNRQRTFGKPSLILRGNFKWMVGRQGKEARKKWLFERIDRFGGELQKRLIPDPPDTVKVLIIIILILPIIMLHTGKFHIS